MLRFQWNLNFRALKSIKTNDIIGWNNVTVILWDFGSYSNKNYQALLCCESDFGLVAGPTACMGSCNLCVSWLYWSSTTFGLTQMEMIDGVEVITEDYLFKLCVLSLLRLSCTAMQACVLL